MCRPEFRRETTSERANLVGITMENGKIMGHVDNRTQTPSTRVVELGAPSRPVADQIRNNTMSRETFILKDKSLLG